VIRYEADLSSGTTVLFGKLLARGYDRQVRLAAALLRAAEDVDGAPLIPPVISSWPDLGLVLQPVVSSGVELHGLVGSLTAPPTVRDTAFVKAGSTLAALHDCRLPEAPGRSFGDDVQELRGYSAAVASADSATGGRYVEVVDAVESSGGSAMEDPVTSHGAFRTDQLLISRDRLVMIDLDTVCRSEPARDVGNLFAYLDWKAIRRPELAAMLDSVRDTFLAGYARRRTLPAPSRVAAYRAASLAKIVGRRFRGLTLTEWPLVPSLLAAAERLASAPAMEAG
jgi:aminoglycoside phosphotransferase (APT) family kinase protein